MLEFGLFLLFIFVLNEIDQKLMEQEYDKRAEERKALRAKRRKERLEEKKRELEQAKNAKTVGFTKTPHEAPTYEIMDDPLKGLTDEEKHEAVMELLYSIFEKGEEK